MFCFVYCLFQTKTKQQRKTMFWSGLSSSPWFIVLFSVALRSLNVSSRIKDCRPAFAAELENLWAQRGSGVHSRVFTYNGHTTYTHDVQRMEQLNLSNNERRPLRRVLLS